jgi:hypothetical protein
MAAGLMLVALLVEMSAGVAAEGRSLEKISKPLSSKAA